MRLLTDTNAFLWFITDSPRLVVKAKALLESRDNERLLSIASVWEIAIKASLGNCCEKDMNALVGESRLAVGEDVRTAFVTKPAGKLKLRHEHIERYPQFPAR